MDVCIKNIDDGQWKTFKSESAKHGMKLGEFFSKLINEHGEKCTGVTWDYLLKKEKTFTDMEAKIMKKSMANFRKGFKMR